MNIKFNEIIKSNPKSLIPASKSKNIGFFEYYVCSDQILYSNFFDNNKPAILLSTGGEFCAHYAEKNYSYSTDVWSIDIKKKFKDKIELIYLYLLILKNKDEINNKGFQGSSIKHLDKKYLDKIKIFIPNINIQKEEIKKFNFYRDYENNIKKQIHKLTNLQKANLQSFFNQNLDDKISKKGHMFCIPSNWKIENLKDALESLKPGPFGSSLTKSMYSKIGYKIYGQEQVIKQNINYGNYYINKEKFNELEAFSIRENDLLMSLVGTFGKTLIVPREFEPGIINPRLIIMRPKQDLIPDYLNLYLNSYLSLEQLSKYQQGGTMGVLSATTLSPLKIIKPEIRDQLKIVEIDNEIKEFIKIYKLKLSKIQILIKELLNGINER